MQSARRVLIVEDDFLVGEKLRGVLEDEGYTVIGDTASGEEAVEMTADLEPDVVMMDLKLLDMDGLTAARRIMAQHPTPIVALTAHETPDLVAEASESGIGYYLVKPVARRELARAIQITVARFEDMMELRRLNADLQNEITERKRAEKDLQKALAEGRRRENEMGWLLAASQAVVECYTFEEAARRIFDVACDATGAVSGYVALMSEDGEENELLFLESGGLPCEVDPDLPMPIRGLRAEAYSRAEVAYDNDFENSEWMKFIPPKHVEMRNILFAPLIIREKAVGVIGLANKPSDFTVHDARMAKAFGDMAAIALRRTQIEDELRESEERFRMTIQLSPIGVGIVNNEGDLTDCNTALAKMVGYTREELLELNFADFTHPDDLERELQLINALWDGKRPEYRMEKRYMHKDGHTVWVDVAASLFKGETGALEFGFAFVEDITERKRAEEELERYAAELERSNQDLERFGYVISHDLREPARVVESYLKLLESRYRGELDEKADKYIDYAVDGAERMQEMISALLDLSRVGTSGGDLTPVDVEAVVERALVGLGSTIQESGAEVTYDPLPTVMADKAQLTQVFQNLIANGIKFRREDTQPRVHISASPSPQGGEGWGEGEWVFSVEDNGIGLEADQTERIFQIFQRLHTEDEYPGLGIGLALCKRIVERHDGRIWVDPDVEEGSTFFFTIPA
jgi:PAS domain S-box-containing protein